MSDNLIFSVQTMINMNGAELRSVTPDSDGVYRAMPLSVIGQPSRNGVLYTPTSLVDAMANENSRFYKNLSEGNLEGEWGHPTTVTIERGPNGQPTVKGKSAIQTAVARTLTIDRTRTSHYFTRVYTEKTRDGAYVIVYGDVVPCGAYGKYLTESLLDPKRNTAFSLRSITGAPKKHPAGYVEKSVLALVTYDAVDGPGYERASKRYMVQPETVVSNEGLTYIDEEQFTVNINDMVGNDNLNSVVGVESVQCQEVLDILRTNTLIVDTGINLVGRYDSSNNVIVTGDGANKSVFHSLF